MAKKSPAVRRAALLASAVAVLGLLTACGGGGSTAGSASSPPGTAEPATGDRPTASASPSASALRSTPGEVTVTASKPPSAASGASGRCHTSELRATVGHNDPGAGQENFPVVLTNTSSRTCTVRGYPGAAFVDASGKQLGPDPKRQSGTAAAVTLAPGKSAWAGMSFSNPEISGADAKTPASLLVTPPDELDHLTVAWTGGEVPVSGNSSTVFLTALSAGTGP